MKVLWLCNGPTTSISRKLKHANGIGWIDGALDGLLEKKDIKIAISFPYKGIKQIMEEETDGVQYYIFPQSPYRPNIYWKTYEQFFERIINRYKPDIVHIWGTEYSHSLSMARVASEKAQVIVNIQGLCSVIPRHYYAYMPIKEIIKTTPRDIVLKDSIIQQKRRFVLQGENEIRTLQLVKNVIGRTDWDRACVKEINKEIHYFQCNESLRNAFYKYTWDFKKCSKHTIFSSQSYYPLKGFHLLIEALSIVLEKFPDTVVYTTGTSPITKPIIRTSGYDLYIKKLIKKHKLKDHIVYLPYQTQEQMVERYLDANIFVLPSSIENSPNSLGEAMLVGTPCIAADVGGVNNFIKHRETGYLYQSDAPYMLAYYIIKVFEENEITVKMSENAKKAAARIFDRKRNAERLVDIYQQISY